MADDDLVCDECGTLNPTDGLYCELCGDPLGEEKEARARRAMYMLLPVAIATTLFVFLAGTLICEPIAAAAMGRGAVRGNLFGDYLFSLKAPGGAKFWLGYTMVFALGILAAPLFEPKDEYDLGYRFGPFLIDKPFNYRDDMDRMHLTLSFLFFPLRIVRSLWKQVFSYMNFQDPGPR